MRIKASKLSRFFRFNRVKSLKGSESPPPCTPSTPKGYVPVCCVGVNNETRRFMVHQSSLTDDHFVELLYKSAEEYGFCNEGILRIAYDAEEFEKWMMRRLGEETKYIEGQRDKQSSS